jgi:hypothetical protein
MKNLTGKTVKELVFEGMLFECDLYSIKRDEYEEKIRLTDGYKKIVRILTATKLIGSEKQIKWANDLRNASANSVAFKAISMSVSNCFKGDFGLEILIRQFVFFVVLMILGLGLLIRLT